jgi:hypothetical protein
MSSMDDLTPMLVGLGYRAIVAEGSVTFHPRPRPKRRSRPPAPQAAEDNPFAKLRALRLVR